MGILGNPAVGAIFGAPGNGRLGDYVFNQEGQSFSCVHAIHLTVESSLGSNNYPNHGKFQWQQACPCFRRDCK